MARATNVRARIMAASGGATVGEAARDVTPLLVLGASALTCLGGEEGSQEGKAGQGRRARHRAREAGAAPSGEGGGQEAGRGQTGAAGEDHGARAARVAVAAARRARR